MFKEKQPDVLLAATLQIILALLFLATVILTLMESVYFVLEQGVFVFTSLGFGVIGLVLSYGLWTPKSWAWLSSLVVNLVAILGVIIVRPESYVKWWYWTQILSVPVGEIVLLTLSAVMVVYLILPRTRTLLTPP